MNPPNKMYIDDDEPPKKKKRGALRKLLVLFIVLMLALVGCGIYIIVDVSKIWGDLGFNENEIVENEPDETADLPEVTYYQGEVHDIQKTNKEIDIMLVGVDNRSDKFTGLSDVMMYLRVNTGTKSIKLCSFMRDTLVKVDGHGNNKLNSAYSYGSVDLMYKTYYKNFGLKPDHFMVVNFYGMEDIVTALGGVDIELEKDELEWLNNCINEINIENPSGKASNIKTAGTQHLNGRQAVAYMRIRHPGGDSARIERQQTVLKQLFKKATHVSASQIPGLVNTLKNYVRTDVPLGTMLELASSVQGMSESNLKTYRFPDQYTTGSYKGAGSVVQPKDFDEEFGKLNDFLNN